MKIGAGGPHSHVPQDGVAELARRIPGGRVVTIPVGHLIHHAAPEAFTEAVSAFLWEIPHRKRPGRDLLPGEEEDNAEHRQVRARVEHASPA